MKCKFYYILKKIFSVFFFPFRNYFILFDLNRLSKRKRVNLNWWNRSKNIGDALSPIVVKYMLSLKGISMNKSVSKRKHLYAIGSNLTSGLQDCTVWGSGILNGNMCYRLQNRKLDIRAVRGPFSRTILLDYGYFVPEIYGDPAILMPEIYNPNKINIKKKYGLVLHAAQNLKKEECYSDILQIDVVTNDYKKFIQKLKSVELVISSSLHGIILAEAYGIPAILLNPPSDYLKYYDWYYSTGRINFPIADTIEQAKMLTPPELPKLDDMRKNIKAVFPYDLYEI